MRGRNYSYRPDTTPANPERRSDEAEDAILRRARIQNGKHPDFVNGHPKDAEKGRIVKPRV